MEFKTLLFIVLSSCLIILTQGQNCGYPTLAQVNSVADASLDALSLSNTDTVVSNASISCLAPSSQRDRFRLATAVIIFTTTSTALQGAGCSANTECISYLEMICNENNDNWERNQIFVTSSFTVDPNAPMNISRTDCGSCGIRSSVPDDANAVFDPQTHCFECSRVCYNQGLSLCRALTDDTCCNFYRNNECVSNCGDRFVSSESLNYTCVCNNSFTGVNCDVCNLQCGQNGTRNQYCMCDCSPGFTGTTCNININDCANVTCQNGGTCNDLVNDYMCSCPNGFEGRNCETNINDCINATCNNGDCIDLVGGFECRCFPGYTGSTCNVTINNCLQNPCLNGGLCINQINNFTCNCSNNFSGRFCTECNNPFLLRNGSCLTSCQALTPCQNGGTCTNLPRGGYSCQCPSGFNGTNCTDTVCQPNPCLNGGTCQITRGTANCTCRPNFSGNKCETCAIKNCMTCSMTTEKKCDKCMNGYTPSNSSVGGCAYDLSTCGSSMNVPLCKWRAISSVCSFTQTECRTKSPKSKYSHYTSYIQKCECYQQLFKDWERRAVIKGVTQADPVGSEGAIGFKHSTEKKLVCEWRNELKDALKALSDWVAYYKRTVTNSNVPPLPDINTEKEDINTIYNKYIQYWNQLVTLFNNEVVPTCSICSDN